MQCQRTSAAAHQVTWSCRLFQKVQIFAHRRFLLLLNVNLHRSLEYCSHFQRVNGSANRLYILPVPIFSRLST